MDAENNQIPRPDFDRWLDAALRARVEAEPSPGLERRVLARLAIKPTRTHFVWWPKLATAAAAVTVIAIAAALLRPTQPGRTIANRTTEPASDSSPATSTHAGSAPGPATILKRRKPLFSGGNARCCGFTPTVAQAQRREHLPKLPSFPTAHPETDQERLLAQLAAQISAQRRFSDIANVSLNAPAKDLSITELRIEPLDSPPADSNPH